MYPATFSQYDEEQAINLYFEQRAANRGTTLENLAPECRFLDIGAYDAKVFSNVRKLYERGWSGFLIEPSPMHVPALVKEYAHSRVQVIQAAMGIEPVLMPIEITGDMVSTADPETRKKHDADGGYFGQMLVVPLTWPQINNWLGGFQFVDIDAEGLSVDLFHSMLNSGARPECVCVEYDNRLAELAVRASKEGYKMLHTNDTNAVFGL